MRILIINLALVATVTGFIPVARAQISSQAAPVGSSGGASENGAASITSHSQTGHAIAGGVGCE